MIKVWTYWEGPMPYHIGLCLASMRKACSDRCEFHVVTPKDVAKFIDMGKLHKGYQLLKSPAHKADCIRALLLATHGGFYFDADTVGLRCPSIVVAPVDLMYVTWDAPPRRVCNAYLYAAPNSDVARVWLEGINTRLRLMARRVDHGLRWTELGEEVLTPLTARPWPASVLVEAPRHVFLPIDVDSDVRTFFTTKDPEEFIKDDTVCFGLNNSWMEARQPGAMREIKTPSNRLLIHKLFNKVKV